MTLKPTIRDGAWVFLAPPPQDLPWLLRIAEQSAKQSEAETRRREK